MNDFFAFLYETLSYLNTFSDDMYNTNAYVPTGLSSVAISLAGMTIYYYLINHPRLNRWFHWFGMSLILAVINFGIAWIMSDKALFALYSEQGQEMPYGYEIFTFSLINAVWTLVFNFVFSMIIKWWSRNCDHTPF
ncbi:MAG: hypothetical protein LBD59_09485 [Prevotellaceae bacterium]|jgi:hypothetical protein|nr:hypothetical protein [Prevotellaceae bacterium]